MGGQRRTHRLGPRERAHRRRLRLGRSGGLVLGDGGLELLELHLHLVEQLAAAFGGGAEAIAVEPGDHQLQMRNHRLRTRGAGLELAPCRPLGQQGGLQRVDVVGNGVGGLAHGQNRIIVRRSRARDFC